MTAREKRKLSPSRGSRDGYAASHEQWCSQGEAGASSQPMDRIFGRREVAHLSLHENGEKNEASLHPLLLLLRVMHVYRYTYLGLLKGSPLQAVK